MLLRLLAVSVQNLGSHLDFRKIGVRIPTTRKHHNTTVRGAMRINGQYIMSIAMNNAILLQHSTDAAPKSRTHDMHSPATPSRGIRRAEIGNRGGVKFLRSFEAENCDFVIFSAVPRGPLRTGRECT